MAEREKKPVSQRRSKLVENLLAQQLAQSGQPAYSPLEVAGRLAMVYALNKDVGKNTAAEQAQTQGLLETISEMTRPTAGFGADTPMLPGRPDSTDVPTPTPEAMEEVLGPDRQHSQLMQVLAGLSQGNPEVVQNLAVSMVGDQLIGAPARARERVAKREDLEFGEELRLERQLAVAADADRREQNRYDRRRGESLEDYDARLQIDREYRDPTLTNIYTPGGGVRWGHVRNGRVFELDGMPVEGRDGVLVGQAPFQLTGIDDLPKNEKAKWNEYHVATLDTLAMNKRLREQAASTQLGVAGFMTRFGDAFVEQGRQLSKFGTEIVNNKVVDNGSLLDPSLYKTTFENFFSGEAKKSSAMQANLVSYAFSRARSRDPGGRLSDQDIEFELRAMGQSGFMSGSANQIIAALEEQEQFIKLGFENRWRVSFPDKPFDPDQHWGQYGVITNPGQATDVPASSPRRIRWEDLQ